MTDTEYAKCLALLYQQVLNLREDKDYVINQPQGEKLIKVLDFFMDEVRDQDGMLEPVRLVPREEHSGVTATFLVFDLYGEKVQRFCDVMNACSAITVDSTEEGVCISCTVPNVFVRRDEDGEVPDDKIT